MVAAKTAILSVFAIELAVKNYMFTVGILMLPLIVYIRNSGFGAILLFPVVRQYSFHLGTLSLGLPWSKRTTKIAFATRITIILTLEPIECRR